MYLDGLVKIPEAKGKITCKEMEPSGRTYEEIIEYLRTAPKRNASQPATKRKYRSRKPKNTN